MSVCKVPNNNAAIKKVSKKVPNINFFDLEELVPTLDARNDKYVVKFTTPYRKFDGTLEELNLEFNPVVAKEFGVHFGTLENETNLDILSNHLRAEALYLEPRKGSFIQLQFGISLDMFNTLEFKREFDTNFTIPGIRLLEIKPKKLRLMLKTMHEGFSIYNKKYAAFKKLSIKGLYFKRGRKAFSFDKFIGKKRGFKAPILSIYPDLKAYFLPKGINLDLDVGNILFAFDPKMKLQGIKIKSINVDIPNMSFGPPDLGFLLRKPSFSMPTLNHYTLNVKSIDLDLRARMPMGWLDFCTKYTFPKVELKGLPDFKLDLGNINLTKNLDLDLSLPGVDPFDPDFDLSLAIGKAFNKPTFGKFGLEIPKINARNAGLSLDLDPNIKMDFDPKASFGRLGKFKNNLDLPDALDIEMTIDKIMLEFKGLNFDSLELKVLWNDLLGRIKMPGLIELLKGCISALLQNLSLEFSLKIILCNVLKAIPKDFIINLLNSFPTQFQYSISASVKEYLDQIPCLGGPYFDLFLQAAAGGGIGLENELEDVFNVLIDIICDFFAGEVGEHKLELQVNAYTQFQEQRKLDKKFELVNKCKFTKPNLDLGLDTDPGSLERKKLAFSAGDLGIGGSGISPEFPDVELPSLGGDGLDGPGGIGMPNIGLPGVNGIPGLGNVQFFKPGALGGLGGIGGLDGIDLPGFTGGKFTGFKNPLDGLGLLLKFLNVIPGVFPAAAIVSMALNKFEKPELPDFDGVIPKFFNELGLPKLTFDEITLPKLQNPLARIPDFFDVQKIGMDFAFNTILNLTIKLLLGMISKAMSGKRRGDKKRQNLGNNPNHSFSSNKSAFPDLVLDGFKGDRESLNATFKLSGLDLDTTLALDFMSELSLNLTSIEMLNLLTGKPDASAVEIIFNLVNLKFHDLMELFDSRESIYDFFSSVSNTLPMEYKSRLKNTAKQVSRGPNPDIPSRLEICKIDGGVEQFNKNRKEILQGRLPNSEDNNLLDQVIALDELLDIQDAEDLVRITQIGVQESLMEGMPPLFADKSGDEPIFDLEPQPVVDAIMNKIEGDVQHMEMSFNNDLFTSGKNRIWGSLNMVMSDTHGNPISTHKTFSSINREYVDHKTVISSSLDGIPIKKELGEGAFPVGVAERLLDVLNDAKTSDRFKIKFEEDTITDEEIDESIYVKKTPTFDFYYDDLSSGIYKTAASIAGVGRNLPLYESQTQLYVGEIKSIFGNRMRVVSDNYRLKISETTRDPNQFDYDFSTLPLPGTMDFGEFASENGISISTTGSIEDKWNRLSASTESVIDLFSFESRTDFSYLTDDKFSEFFEKSEDLATNPNILLLSKYLNSTQNRAKMMVENWTELLKANILNTITANSSSFEFGYKMDPLTREEFTYLNPDATSISDVYSKKEKEKILGISYNQLLAKQNDTTPRVIYLDPEEFGGKYKKPPVQVVPFEYDGWYGLIQDLMRDDEESEIKSPLSFDSVLTPLKENYKSIKEDERLSVPPNNRMNYPFMRLLDKPTKVSLLAIYESYLLSFCTHHIIKNYNFYSNYKLNFFNNSDLTADYIVNSIEETLKDPRVTSKDMLKPGKRNKNFWFDLLEFSVEYYFNKIQGDDLFVIPAQIASYIEYLNNKRTEIDGYNSLKELYEFIDCVECECRTIFREVVKMFAERAYNNLIDYFDSLENNKKRFLNLTLFDTILRDPKLIKGVSFFPSTGRVFEEDYTNGLDFLNIHGFPYTGPVKIVKLGKRTIYYGSEPDAPIEKCNRITLKDNAISIDTIGDPIYDDSVFTLQMFVVENDEKKRLDEFTGDPGQLATFGLRLSAKISGEPVIIFDYVDTETLPFNSILSEPNVSNLFERFYKSNEYNLLFNYCLMSNKMLSFVMIYMDNNFYPSIGQKIAGSPGVKYEVRINNSATSGFTMSRSSTTEPTPPPVEPTPEQQRTSIEDYNVSVSGWLPYDKRNKKSDGITNLSWDDWTRDEMILTTRTFRMKMERMYNLLCILPGAKLSDSASKEDRRQKKNAIFEPAGNKAQDRKSKKTRR